MDHEDELALTIVEAVAERDGVDVTDLQPPLHDVVDTDALESLFERTPDGATASVSFAYCGYTVRVDATGDVEISDAELDTADTTLCACS